MYIQLYTKEYYSTTIIHVDMMINFSNQDPQPPKDIEVK